MTPASRERLIKKVALKEKEIAQEAKEYHQGGQIQGRKRKHKRKSAEKRYKGQE